jgi:hypothetical protein
LRPDRPSDFEQVGNQPINPRHSFPFPNISNIASTMPTLAAVTNVAFKPKSLHRTMKKALTDAEAVNIVAQTLMPALSAQ